MLFPFVFKDLPIIFSAEQGWLLLLLGIISLVVALMQFQALKIGKISAIEPILSFELPITVLLGVLILHENLSGIQVMLIALVFMGILLIGYAGKNFHPRHLFEKGALLALTATGFMAIVNFLTGLSSLRVGPVVTIWFVHTFLALACIIYFFATKSWRTFAHHIRQHPIESFWVAVCDNTAWLAYATAATIIPISLVITISENYIILAILLGVIINREKLLKHQWVGVGISLIAVIILSSIS